MGIPSRGGTDEFPGGRVVVNVPVRPLFPSAGLGSYEPNSLELEAKLREYAEKRRVAKGIPR